MFTRGRPNLTLALLTVNIGAGIGAG